MFAVLQFSECPCKKNEAVTKEDKINDFVSNNWKDKKPAVHKVQAIFKKLSKI